MKAEIKGQPMEIAIGPPLFHAWLNVVKHPLKIDITENEIAKFENADQDRFNSCLYPSAAKSFSSLVVIAGSCVVSGGVLAIS